MNCSFCGGEGWAFCPLGLNEDVWVPCPRCEAGGRHELEPRAKAILGDRDPRTYVAPLPQAASPQQSKRMLAAITRTFYVGRDPAKQETAREKKETEAA